MAKANGRNLAQTINLPITDHANMYMLALRHFLTPCSVSRNIPVLCRPQCLVSISNIQHVSFIEFKVLTALYAGQFVSHRNKELGNISNLVTDTILNTLLKSVNKHCRRDTKMSIVMFFLLLGLCITF